MSSILKQIRDEWRKRGRKEDVPAEPEYRLFKTPSGAIMKIWPDGRYSYPAAEEATREALEKDRTILRPANIARGRAGLPLFTSVDEVLRHQDFSMGRGVNEDPFSDE